MGDAEERIWADLAADIAEAEADRTDHVAWAEAGMIIDMAGASEAGEQKQASGAKTLAVTLAVARAMANDVIADAVRAALDIVSDVEDVAIDHHVCWAAAPELPTAPASSQRDAIEVYTAADFTPPQPDGKYGQIVAYSSLGRGLSTTGAPLTADYLREDLARGTLDSHPLQALRPADPYLAWDSLKLLGKTVLDMYLDASGISQWANIIRGSAVTGLLYAASFEVADEFDSETPCGSITPVCFAAGTPILMADGSTKPIEAMQRGDMVLAASDQDPEGAVEPKPVVEVYHNRPDRLMGLHIGDMVIRPTLKHPFYAKGKGWTAASELEIGDELRTHDGGWVKLTGKHQNGDVKPVFNFHVGDRHTYFVGKTGDRNCNAVLVHNDSGSESEASSSDWSFFENDRIEYCPSHDGKVHLYYVDAGWLWNEAPVHIGTFDPFDPRRLVQQDEHLVAISKVQAEVSGMNTTDNWAAWFAKNAVDLNAPNYINIVHGNAHPDRFDRLAKVQNAVGELATTYVTFVVTAPFSVRVASYGPGRLSHSFNSHAAQWFGREVKETTHLKAWADLIDRARKSNLVLWHN